MATKKTPGIDIFSSRAEIAGLMEAATGEPTEVPTVETVRTQSSPDKVVKSDEAPDAPVEAPSDAIDEEKPESDKQATKAAKKTAPRTRPLPSMSESNVEFRFRIPKELKVEWATFKAELSGRLDGVSLDDSNVGRALMEVILFDYKDQILSQAGEFEGQLRRPANTDRVGMAELEAEISEIFRKGLRQRRRKQQ